MLGVLTIFVDPRGENRPRYDQGQDCGSVGSFYASTSARLPYVYLSDAGETADPSVLGLLIKSSSHATLACYKALSKANPAVSPSNWVTIFRTEAYVVGEALGEDWTSKNRRSMQIGGGITPITSHSPKFEPRGPINPGRVRDSVPRSLAMSTNDPSLSGRTQIAAGSTTVLGIGPGWHALFVVSTTR